MRLEAGPLGILVGLGLMVCTLSACRPVPAEGTLLRSKPSATARTIVSPNPAVPPTQTPSPCLSATPTQEGWPIVPAKARPAVNWARSETPADTSGADLASRLQIGEDQIEDRIRMSSIETVEWRDSSLGCLEMGRGYLQVTTPGYRIVLRAGGKLYEYHAAQGQDRAILS